MGLLSEVSSIYYSLSSWYCIVIFFVAYGISAYSIYSFEPMLNEIQPVHFPKFCCFLTICWSDVHGTLIQLNCNILLKQVPDLRSEGWNYDDLISYFKVIGKENVVRMEMVYTNGYDVLYPIAYHLFFAAILSKLHPPPSKLNLIPLVIFIFDMMENVCLWQICELYLRDKLTPNEPWIKIGSTMCIAKWYMLYVFFGAVAYGVVKQIYNWITSPKNKNQ